MEMLLNMFAKGSRDHTSSFAGSKAMVWSKECLWQYVFNVDKTFSSRVEFE